MIRIVTDSGSGLTPAQVRQYNIPVVPLCVHFGTESFREGIDIQAPEFFARLKASPQLPTTSQPSAGDFLEVYQSLAGEADDIISIHLSSKLSGTYASACTASNMAKGVRVHVCDTGLISAAEAMVVMEAARMAQAGQPVGTILARVQQLSDGFKILFTVDTLEYLQKGGRIGKAAALLGTALQMKPLLAIEGGVVEAKERIRTKSKALARIADVALEHAAGRSRVFVGVMHAAVPEEARQLGADLFPKLNPEQTLIAEVGPVIATHGGPGLIGVVLYAE